MSNVANISSSSSGAVLKPVDDNNEGVLQPVVAGSENAKTKRKVRKEKIGEREAKAKTFSLKENAENQKELVARHVASLTPKVDKDETKNDVMTELEKETLEFLKKDLVEFIKEVQSREDVEGKVKSFTYNDLQGLIVKLQKHINQKKASGEIKGDVKNLGSLLVFTLGDLIDEIEDDKVNVDLIEEIPDKDLKEFVGTLMALYNLLGGATATSQIAVPAAGVVIGKALLDRLLPFLPNHGKWAAIATFGLGAASYIVISAINSAEVVLEPWMQYFPLFFAVLGGCAGFGIDSHKDRNRKANEMPLVSTQIADARLVAV